MKMGWLESATASKPSALPLALWNERDPILKERLFGLTGNQGNHGEDVKEYYFYLDSTPTHSYMKYLYKYPQAEFPYDRLVEENRRRGKSDPEFELLDTGIFDDNRYFDVFVEYAKADTEDILIRISVSNRGPEAANLRLLPTIWFRNTWSWGTQGTGQNCIRYGRRQTRWLNSIITRPAHVGCIVKVVRSCCSRKTKPMYNGCTATKIARPMLKMASMITSSPESRKR